MSAPITVKASERVSWTYENPERVREGIKWLEDDAAYLDGRIAEYRAMGPCWDWLAERISANAANSRRLAGMMRASIGPTPNAVL